MDSPRLCICFLFILISLVSLTTPQPELRSNRCSDSGNYTTNSTYARNLNALLSSIPASSDLNSDGFFNSSIGQNPNQVYAIGLCRGDLAVASCRSCLNDSVQAIIQACPNQKEAGRWHDLCMLRFSNRNILGSMDGSFVYVAWNIGNETNEGDELGNERFNSLRGYLLFNLRDQAAAGSLRKYAADVVNYKPLLRFYATEQCTPDISELDCKSCLNSAIKDVTTYCNGRLGCSSIKPSCALRFETYQFFQLVADAPVSTNTPDPSILSFPLQWIGQIHIPGFIQSRFVTDKLNISILARASGCRVNGAAGIEGGREARIMLELRRKMKGDVDPDTCRRCVDDSTRRLRQLCPNQKEAIVYYDDCMVRHSNRSIFGIMETTPSGYLVNVACAPHVVQLNQALISFLEKLQATGKRVGPDNLTSYGLCSALLIFLGLNALVA
ncbi:hypothetical protein RJ639_042787 [Escallonia herrerae]|uniref:Gnk2-homologous domain-containing protein n=1 Tax=Escallonia herrerae TaxID=1293975 RepID=A0AA88WMM4_9ASTE|nr:hypothetical protein RJ639_042787 [Escallonia herrerae]